MTCAPSVANSTAKGSPTKPSPTTQIVTFPSRMACVVSSRVRSRTFITSLSPFTSLLSMVINNTQFRLGCE